MTESDLAVAVEIFAERVVAAANDLAHAARTAVSDGDGPEEPDVSGKRQRLVVEVLSEREARNGREGVKVADIAKAMGYDDHPNTLLALRGLERKGVAELVPGRSPQHWRLTERYARGRRVWTRDELILAMQHYVASGGSWRQDELEELKQRLDRVALRDGHRGRTIASIHFKLGNLQAIETEGREGFPHYGSGDKDVWEEFAGDRDALDAAARAILEPPD